MPTAKQLKLIDQLKLCNAEISICTIITTTTVDRDKIIEFLNEVPQKELTQEGWDMVHLILGYKDRIVNRKLMAEYNAFHAYLMEWKASLKK